MNEAHYDGTERTRAIFYYCVNLVIVMDGSQSFARRTADCSMTPQVHTLFIYLLIFIFTVRKLNKIVDCR